jgi:hypothetical protein
MANRQLFQLTAKASSSINLTDVIPVQSNSSIVDAGQINVGNLQNFVLQRPTSTVSLNTTSSATTSNLSYGVNIVYTSSYNNNSTKLPSASTGSTVTVINASNNVAKVFPQTGGKINNSTNISFDVPADNLAYTFTCYATSGSSTIGHWSTNRSQNSNMTTLRYPTMFVPHITGSGTGTTYYGIGYQNITGSASGSGLAWTGSATYSAIVPYTVLGTAGPNYSLLLIPSASVGGGRQLVWKSEVLPTTAKKLRVYTNISGSDISSNAKIYAQLIRTYYTELGDLIIYEPTATLTFTTGSPNNTSIFPSPGATVVSSSFTPIRVRDYGTLFGEIVLPDNTQIGTQTTNYGPYYYTFAIQIENNCATKNYLFDFEIDYI